ncbi:MAG: hypothetical protein NUV97_02750, partial [archaeon]|nr:hypothetical protein [archaeon]
TRDEEIYKSTDSGANWVLMKQPFTDKDSANQYDLSSETKSTTLSFQVRNCTQSNCGDGSWQDVNLTSFNLVGQYFQYKVIFTSPDSSITSSLESVDVGYDLINQAPTITLISPQEGATYGYNESLPLDFSASDVNDNIDSCWYNLNGESNISLASCTNTTFDIPNDRDYTLNIYMNDTNGELASDSVTFSTQLGAPSIILNSPTDSSYSNSQSVTFRYTPTDLDLNSCWLLGDFGNGFEINQTDNSPTNGIENIFSSNLLDGEYLWNVGCNDSVGNSVTNGNKTFYIDTIAPSVSVSEPTGAKTSRTLSATWSVSDASPVSCLYNVYRGESLEISNTSVNCSTQSTSFGVTVDANFIFNFYVNDSAGNSNRTNSSFSVDTSSGGGAGGGESSSGGGGSGGGPYTPYVAGINLEIESIEIIAYPGEEKTLEVVVKNNALKTVNKCQLKISEEQRSWFSSTDVENIGAGEIMDFAFTLTPPSNAGQPEIFIECLEGEKEVPIKLIMIKPSLNIEFTNIVLEKENKIYIKYSVESDSDQTTNLRFSIYSGKDLIKEQTQEVELTKDKKTEHEITIELGDNNPSGVLKISVINEGGEKPLLEDSVIYDSSIITGFATTGFGNNSTSYTMGFIIIIFLVFAILIIRRILREKKSTKKK